MYKAKIKALQEENRLLRSKIAAMELGAPVQASLNEAIDGHTKIYEAEIVYE
jgi:hypothetical protein